MATFNIGKEFSLDPSGRFYSDGDGNGEEFREEYLLPKLNTLSAGEKLIIVLDDGVESYGSSFLTEAFANVVKYGYMDASELLSKLEIKYSDPEFEFFKDRIIQYIKESKFNAKKYVSTK